MAEHSQPRVLLVRNTRPALAVISKRDLSALETAGKAEETESVTALYARHHFSEVCGAVQYGRKRIIVTRNGKDSLVFVPLADLEYLENLEVGEAVQKSADQAPVSVEELAQRLGISNLVDDANRIPR